MIVYNQQILLRMYNFSRQILWVVHAQRKKIMTKKQKILISLLTAGCLTVGAFGLAACNNSNNNSGNTDNTPEVTVPDGGEDDAAAAKTTLIVGENSISVEANEKIDYTFTPSEDGTYTFSTAMTDYDVYVTIGSDEILVIGPQADPADEELYEYVIAVKANQTITLKCESLSREASSYTLVIEKTAAYPTEIVVGEDTSLSTTNGVISSGKITISEAGTYKVTITNDSANPNVDYTVQIGERGFGSTYYFTTVSHETGTATFEGTIAAGTYSFYMQSGANETKSEDGESYTQFTTDYTSSPSFTIKIEKVVEVTE
jgi:hypothetical protein